MVFQEPVSPIILRWPDLRAGSNDLMDRLIGPVFFGERPTFPDLVERLSPWK